MIYSEIRDEILLTLRVPTSMTGDTRALVETKMKSVVDFLVRRFKPTELLVTAPSFTVTSATTSVSIATDFSVDVETDLGWVHAVALDYDQSGDNTPKTLERIEYPAWINLNSAYAGNQRAEYTYTIDDGYNIILRRWPQTTQDWDMYLYYFGQVPAITDNGEPPLPVYHHTTIVAGVIQEFPHFFQGKREDVFNLYRAMYQEKTDALLRTRLPGPGGLRFRPAKSIKTNKRDSNVFPESV